jgi:uncharacterized protein YukJ
LQDGIDRKATFYVFGSHFSDREDGMHEVHMNQGSLPRYESGVFQDGALFLNFQDDGHWEGVFLAFASQKLPTDDRTGLAEPGATELVQMIEEANPDNVLT